MSRHSRWTTLTLCSLLALGLTIASDPALAGEHRIGGGLHFWKTLDDLAGDAFEGIDDEGSTWVVSYQYVPKGLLRFELDLEYDGDGFGGSTSASYSPVAFVLAGHGLYGGVGVGLTYSDGLADDVSDLFYIARVGFEFHLLPKIRLDLNGNWRSGAFDELDDFDSDAVTVGALIRFSL